MILLACNSASTCNRLANILRSARHTVLAVHSLDSAVGCLRAVRCDWLITESHLAEANEGLRLVQECSEISPQTKVVVITDEPRFLAGMDAYAHGAVVVIHDVLSAQGLAKLLEVLSSD